MSDYSFKVTPWDLANGIAPQLLTIVRRRASVIAERNMQMSNTENQTAANRGAYLELTLLIKALEKAGVTPYESSIPAAHPAATASTGNSTG